MYLNTCFHFLNNITRIFTHFFTHIYFQKNRKLLFKHTYQTGPKTSINYHVEWSIVTKIAIVDVVVSVWGKKKS